MSAFALTNVTVLVGGYDLTNFSGGFDLGVETAMLPVTNFGSLGYPVFTPGLTTATGALNGWADFASGGVSQTFQTAQVGSQQAFTILPNGSNTAVGDPAQFMRGRLNKMSLYKGNTGDAAAFDMSLTGDNADVNGIVLIPQASRGAVTGTQQTLPAVTATQQMFAVLHVTGAVGTNLGVKVQSAATADTGFASPTDRITFSTVSAVGFQFASIVGPFTDTRWRAVATIGSSTFTWALAIGIL